MKGGRLGELERRARALLNGDALVTAIFSDGTQRRLRLPDVIPLLLDGPGPRVADVSGEAASGQGKLLELIQGIVREEAPNI